MPPTFLACPTAIIEAPFGVVWRLLTNISGWGNFYDVRVISVEPPGPAVKGQRMLGKAGPRWFHFFAVVVEYTRIDEANNKLELDLKLPFGITVHEDLDCVPLEANRCRVNYHCNFTFPAGWRGSILRLLLNRELTTGPEDSLSRLKRAAEQAFSDQKAKQGVAG